MRLIIANVITFGVYLYFTAIGKPIPPGLLLVNFWLWVIAEGLRDIHKTLKKNSP